MEPNIGERFPDSNKTKVRATESDKLKEKLQFGHFLLDVRKRIDVLNAANESHHIPDEATAERWRTKVSSIMIDKNTDAWTDHYLPLIYLREGKAGNIMLIVFPSREDVEIAFNDLCERLDGMKSKVGKTGNVAVQ